MTAGTRSLLLHPIVLAALGLLLLNDHVLKALAPGAITGKLSDVAGLVVFPLLLAEGLALLDKVIGRPLIGAPGRIEARSLVPGAVAATVVAFATVKLSPVAADAWAASLGWIQWLAGAGWARAVSPIPVVVAVDPSDLLAIPAVLVPLALARTVPQGAIWRPLGSVRPGAARRLPTIAIGIVTALACIATSPPPPSPFTSTIDGLVNLTEDDPVLVRHFVWSIGVGGVKPTELEVSAQVRDSGEDAFDTCPINGHNIEIRLVPDDPSLVAAVRPREGCDRATLDLLAACLSGCHGGATMILYLDPAYAERDDVTANGRAELVVALRGSPAMGRATNPASGGTLQLVANPRQGEDHAARSETGIVEGVIDVFPSDPNVTVAASLHIPAAALREPLSGLAGLARVGIRHVDGDFDLGAIQRIRVGNLDPFTSTDDFAADEVDWLRQCEPSVDCDIEIEFEVTSPNAAPTATADFYRWVINASLVSLDGRELPVDPVTVEDLGVVDD